MLAALAIAISLLFQPFAIRTHIVTLDGEELQLTSRERWATRAECEAARDAEAIRLAALGFKLDMGDGPSAVTRLPYCVALGEKA